MGYAITWCAVREDVAEQLLAHLGLALTGEVEDDVPDARFSTAELPGWRVIWSNRHACPTLLKGIPTFGHEVVLCQIEEHVMASSAELWSSGARTWSLSHEGESGPKGLETAGALPQCLASIQQDMEQMQRAEGGDSAQVDYIFEIPLKVAQVLVGFKHDEYDDTVTRRFKVLSSSKNTQGFLSRLFAGWAMNKLF